MSDYMPLEVITKILSKLSVKSVVKCRSVCKSWNTLISDPSFISAHLQASLSNNTPFLLIGCEKHSRETLSLHHDNDGFDKFKQLPFPPFGNVTDFPVIGSCNGLICVQLDYYDYDLDFVLWNPSIQKYISLPQANICEVEYFNVGFGFDSKTNDYKLLILGVDKDGYQKRNNGGHSHVILGFDLSAEVFSVINLPQSLTGFSPFDLSVMKYGESSFAVSLDSLIGEIHELWVIKEYDGVEPWTKVLTLHSVDRADILSLNSYVKSLVLLDKAVDVSSESDVNHPIDSSDSDESIGGD
ncbi:hypothetical protein GQ457_02G032580 [Hibiscus cannabinus]